MKRLLFLVFIVQFFSSIQGQNYLQVIKSEANIRFSPSTSSSIIAQAKEGNIFKLTEEKGEWYGISMFSGEYRYIHKSLCKKVNHTPLLPENEQIRKQLFIALFQAEGRAIEEADKKYPIQMNGQNINKNIDFNRLLDDRYKLAVFNRFNLQPTIYSKLIMEGATKRWDQ